MKVKKEWDERMVKDERKRRDEESDDGERKPKAGMFLCLIAKIGQRNIKPTLHSESTLKG